MISVVITPRYGADCFARPRPHGPTTRRAALHLQPCSHLAQATLLGLLSACAGELGTLRCAARVVGADGAAALTAGYRACTAPLRVDDPA